MTLFFQTIIINNNNLCSSVETIGFTHRIILDGMFSFRDVIALVVITLLNMAGRDEGRAGDRIPSQFQFCNAHLVQNCRLCQGDEDSTVGEMHARLREALQNFRLAAQRGKADFHYYIIQAV